MSIPDDVAKNIIRAIRGLARGITDRAVIDIHCETGGAYHEKTYKIIQASAESVLTEYMLGEFNPSLEEDEVT